MDVSQTIQLRTVVLTVTSTPTFLARNKAHITQYYQGLVSHVRRQILNVYVTISR